MDTLSKMSFLEKSQTEPARLSHRRSRTDDNPSVERLHEALSKPGAVKINVKGAFIIDEDRDGSPPPQGAEWDGIQWDKKDIRLPHHCETVSHVAIDVSALSKSECSTSD